MQLGFFVNFPNFCNLACNFKLELALESHPSGAPEPGRNNTAPPLYGRQRPRTCACRRAINKIGTTFRPSGGVRPGCCALGPSPTDGTWSPASGRPSPAKAECARPKGLHGRSRLGRVSCGTGVSIDTCVSPGAIRRATAHHRQRLLPQSPPSSGSRDPQGEAPATVSAYKTCPRADPRPQTADLPQTGESRPPP